MLSFLMTKFLTNAECKILEFSILSTVKTSYWKVFAQCCLLLNNNVLLACIITKIDFTGISRIVLSYLTQNDYIIYFVKFLSYLDVIKEIGIT